MLAQSRTGTIDSLSGWRSGTQEVFEALEPRKLLSAPPPFEFYAVGGAFAEGVVVLTDGSVDSNGAVTGMEYASAPGGPGQPEPFTGTLDWLDNGAFELHRPGNYTTMGAQFLSSDGHSVGWYDSADPDGDGFGFLIEKAQDVTLSSFNGQWALSGLWMDGQDFGGSWATLSINSGQISGEWHEHDDQGNFSNWITESHADGSAVIDNGIQIYLSRDRQAILIVKLDLDEGPEFNVAVRTDSAPSLDQIAGTYRFADSWAGDPGIPSTNTGVVSITSDGTWATYDLAQYDAGTLLRDDTGTVTLNGNTATLRSTIENTDEWTTGVFTAGGGTLLVQSWTDPSGTYPIVGLGVKISDDPIRFSLQVGANGAVYETSTSDNTHLQVARNTDGDLIVLTGGGSSWTGLRLNDYTATPTVTGDPIIWTDPNDGLAYVAAPSANGFLLFRRATDGTWTYRDLAAETSTSAGAPVGTLSYFTSRPKSSLPKVFVAGINAAGDIVFYRQTNASDPNTGAVWTHYNISDDLASQSMTTPAFTQMTSYVTSWNQWTLAGLDASGNVQGVWVNVATFTTWRVDNLSVITGADPLTGELDVTLTTWGGIRFAGASASGQLVATWWNPALGPGNWNQTDLTAAVPNNGGPALTGGQLTAWFAPGNLISYAGYDAGGDIVSFYWQPSFGGVWNSDNLTGSLNNRPSRPVGRITSHVSATGETSIVGASSSRDVVRLWAFSGSGTFSLDNLSDLAVRV